MWNLDLALAAVVSTTTEPALGAIRLAWWRERLEELDSGTPPPDEPRLRAIARQLVGRGVRGGELSRLEDAWLPLLEPFPWDAAQALGLRLRGEILFGVGARLLGADPTPADRPGALWSLVDGAQHCSDAASREMLLDQARKMLSELPNKLPRDVRPLTVLGALAAHDLTGGSAVGRVAAAFAHRLRGTIPRS